MAHGSGRETDTPTSSLNQGGGDRIDFYYRSAAGDGNTRKAYTTEITESSSLKVRLIQIFHIISTP